MPAPTLLSQLSSKVIGQDHAMEKIAPYVLMHQAGIAPEGRPVAVFLLLGPTGTGKTRTVEALAEVLHGSSKSMLKVDCGEFQMEHEVAKLIGAPPGYLGHRETHPMLTTQKLNAATSDKCSISLVLFDEIEKGASSLQRLLLGIMDKATLRLGDNTTVNFERSIIFLTSNVGADQMQKEMGEQFGFVARKVTGEDITKRLESIGVTSLKKRFSPEFMNRIDASIVFRQLSRDSLRVILDQQLTLLDDHLFTRLGAAKAFNLEQTDNAIEWLLNRGTSAEYGARELKRLILRTITQPLAVLIAEGRLLCGDTVIGDVVGDELVLRVER